MEAISDKITDLTSIRDKLAATKQKSQKLTDDVVAATEDADKLKTEADTALDKVKESKKKYKSYIDANN